MKYLAVTCAFLFGCLPTGTGNPLSDAAPSSDAGPSFDSAPSYDSGPTVSDAAPTDASNDTGPGADAGCVDAGFTGCGSEPQIGCDCLSGPPTAVGAGAPVALIDHEAEDGRATLIRFRRDGVSAAGDLDSVVLRDGVVESEAVIVRGADRANDVVVSVGARTVVSWVQSRGTLMMADVDLATNEVSEPVEVLTRDHIRRLALAQRDGVTAVAFAGAMPGDTSEHVHFFRVPDDGSAPTIRQHAAGMDLHGLALAPSGTGWMLSYTGDEGVETLALTEEGEAVGAPVRIGTSNNVPSLFLQARPGGFVFAYEGTVGAVHLLDAGGTSVAERPLTGRLVALGWADDEGEGTGMLLTSERLDCRTDETPLTFTRFDTDLQPHHEPVRVGAADDVGSFDGRVDGAVTLIDGAPFVSFTRAAEAQLVPTCVGR